LWLVLEPCKIYRILEWSQGSSLQLPINITPVTSRENDRTRVGPGILYVRELNCGLRTTSLSSWQKERGREKLHPYHIQSKFMDVFPVHFGSLIGTRTRSFEILPPLIRHFLVAGAFLHTRTKSFPYTDLEKSLINMPWKKMTIQILKILCEWKVFRVHGKSNIILGCFFLTSPLASPI